MYSCLKCENGSEPYDMIMSYTRWNALRATVGFSDTRSRYSENVPSQCCSRKFVTSSLRSMMLINGLVLAMAMGTPIYGSIAPIARSPVCFFSAGVGQRSGLPVSPSPAHLLPLRRSLMPRGYPRPPWQQPRCHRADPAPLQLYVPF